MQVLFFIYFFNARIWISLHGPWNYTYMYVLATATSICPAYRDKVFPNLVIEMYGDMYVYTYYGMRSMCIDRYRYR